MDLEPWDDVRVSLWFIARDWIDHAWRRRRRTELNLYPVIRSTRKTGKRSRSNDRSAALVSIMHRYSTW